MCCSRDHACPGLEIYLPELPKASTVAPGQGTLTTVSEIEKSKRLPSPSSSEHFKVKPTCLAHKLSSSSNDFKMCLRQRSGSARFGEFHMLLDQKEHVVYVLRTSELAGTIGAACSKNNGCSFIAETEYSSDLCEDIFETGVSTYVEPGITMEGQDVVSGIPVDEQKTSVKEKELWCLAVKRSEVIPPAKSLYGHYERIMRCIKCVTEILKETVHWMNVNAGPEDKAFFLYRSEALLKRRVLVKLYVPSPRQSASQTVTKTTMPTLIWLQLKTRSLQTRQNLKRIISLMIMVSVLWLTLSLARTPAFSV